MPQGQVPERPSHQREQRLAPAQQLQPSRGTQPYQRQKQIYHRHRGSTTRIQRGDQVQHVRERSGSSSGSCRRSSRRDGWSRSSSGSRRDRSRASSSCCSRCRCIVWFIVGHRACISCALALRRLFRILPLLRFSMHPCLFLCFRLFRRICCRCCCCCCCRRFLFRIGRL